MINIILPRVYESYSINNFFKNIINNSQLYCKEKNIVIFATKGSFPYGYWNGGRINNKGSGVFHRELNELSLTKIKTPIIFDCSNIFIEEKDYADTYMNTILNFFNNGANFIEVSNKDFFNYLLEKFPYYKYVLSEKYYLTDQDYEDAFLSNISYYLASFNNTNFIETCKEKNKIILNINNTCFLCNNFSNCDLITQKNQYNFSEEDIYFNCPEFLKNKLKICPLENLKDYLKLEISYFYIEDNFKDNQEYFYFLLDYLIKPEKQREVLELWERKK